LLITFESADRKIVIPSRIREIRQMRAATINVVQWLDEGSRPLLSVIFKLNMFGSRVACSSDVAQGIEVFRDGTNEESVYGA